MKKNDRDYRFQVVDRTNVRVEALLSQLTLDEKITLLGGHKEGQTQAVERLGVPHFRMADGPVGIHWWCEKSTAYPASITLASSWDRGLSHRLGKALGRDCRARGVHILLAPGVNIYRSPLCGRNFEYLGEDPVLAGELVASEIRGIQDQGVAATVKHYALNNQEFDRHDVSSDADERTIREIYLPAFEKAVKEGGVAAIMTAYNLVNGSHCSQHDWLIKTVLREEWGFQGVVMSDWSSVYSTAGAINAGIDLEMPTAKFLTAGHIKTALRNGLITEETITTHVRHILALGMAFGWFDHPQKDDAIPWDDPASAATALDISRAGMVLLKNENQFLPLCVGKIKNVVVLGHHAGRSITCGGGSAYTPPYHTINLLEGLKSAAPQVEFSYFPAVDLDAPEKAFKETEFRSPDGKPGLLGEYFNNNTTSGTPIRTRQDERINFNWAFANESFKTISPDINPQNFSVRWHGTFTPQKDGDHVFYMLAHEGFMRLLLNGEPVADSTGWGMHFSGTVTRKLAAGQPCKIELYYYKRIGRDWNEIYLGVSHEDATRLDYSAAMTAARSADAVIVSAGFTARSEVEGRDREFSIGDLQERLILDAAQANPHTVAAIYAGGNIDMNRWIDRVKGLLYLWYPGQDGARAAAEILFGKVNPSGKLPATFEKNLEDRSSFTSYLDEDRDRRISYDDGIFCGYRHHDRQGHPPRFPFGFGLSYTTFSYQNPKLAKQVLKYNETLTVSVDITNTGKCEGTEIVQFYVRDEKASIPRPLKELKGFDKVTLSPGETKTVTVHLPPRAFQFWHPDRNQWFAEPGIFEILIAASATDIRLTEKIELM